MQSCSTHSFSDKVSLRMGWCVFGWMIFRLCQVVGCLHFCILGLVCCPWSCLLLLLPALGLLSNGRSVRIESIDVAKREIVVLGLDCIEGTPVLDIKPYLPCMCPMVPQAPCRVQLPLQSLLQPSSHACAHVCCAPLPVDACVVVVALGILVAGC